MAGEHSAPARGQPHGTQLLRLALLPSMDLHPARLADLPAGASAWLARLQPQSPAWRRLHRHWSQTFALAPLDLDEAAHDPALPLALLPEPHWSRLQRVAGAGLAAGCLRHIIAREPVALLRRALGEPAYAWVLAQPDGPCSGQARSLPAADLLPACERWGAEMLWHAMAAAAPALAERLRLRLAPDAAQETAPAPGQHRTPEQALQTLLDIIRILDPRWLSSFPATR